jgi:hypothetical protein
MITRSGLTQYKDRNHKAFFFAGSIVLSLLSLLSFAQIKIDVRYNRWNAEWIEVPGTDATAYGVYHFRKTFNIVTIPATFPVYVSADNRYKLFVNGSLVSVGPTRGDLAHWNFQTVDLLPYLKLGNNTLAALVWNEGAFRPEAHLSLRTSIILQGGNKQSEIVNTNSSWKCIQDSSYSPIPVVINAYYVSGPGECVKNNPELKGWEELSFRDINWKNARPITNGYPKNYVGPYGVIDSWQLVPSSIPEPELVQQRLLKLREPIEIKPPPGFPATKQKVTVPANSNVTLLLDQTFLTNAYPTIVFSGGKGGAISLTYAEALYSIYPQKGNRNETAGKVMIGRKDSIVSDGSDGQQFTSLNWRTYRYIQLHVVTKESPLVLEDIYGSFTAYPFRFNAKLETDNTELKNILNIGWRTARLCAVETYMDCPYYEQLQYIGDTRIQALVSLYNSADDHLVRNAINLIDQSRLPEGLTESRHPSKTPQYIPPFSLFYIGMLHDYLMYGKNISLVKEKLPAVRGVLSYFRNFQLEDGSLKNLPHWSFTDWVNAKGWNDGDAPVGEDGCSAVLDLQLLWAYQLAADLELQFGIKEFAKNDLNAAAQLKNTIRKKYWDSKRHCFADRTEKDLFSQHANTLAILTGMLTKEQNGELAKLLLTDTSMAACTIYFKYYLHQALVKAGLGDDYLKWLDKWRENINFGLTTWAEMSDVNTSRSDYHAWGSSPNIELFRTLLGIDSDAPGFGKVVIEPHLGNINTIGGEMPHPDGKIKVYYSHSKNKLVAQIYLPSNVPGKFIWKGHSYPLRGGKNELSISDQQSPE